MTIDPRRQTLGDALRRTARRYPDKLALTTVDVVWTYAQFDAECNRLAHGLADLGIGKGERVAVFSRNSYAWAALRFALARLGAVLVPINFMLNAHEVAYILGHSGARSLAAATDLADTALRAAGGTDVARFVWLPVEGSSTNAAPTAMDGTPFADLRSERLDEPDVALATHDLAQIIYTSGTESSPKGAMLTHDALLWEYASTLVDAEITRDDVILHALPLYHCAQLDAFFGPALYVGATNVLTGQPRPDVLLPLIEQHRVSSFFAPPTVWISLLRSPLFDSCDLSSLRKAYYGASIMPLEVLREMNRRLPRVRFWNLYGQTEIAPLATALQPGDALRKPGSVGQPSLNVETRVVDDSMQDVAPGEIGEVVHRSPHLQLGYYRDEERSREAFVGGWFHSGDLATMDAEGYISVVDRKKDMIKTGAENVASREVEEVLYLLPAVSEVAVIGLPHPLWVEAVTAVVVVRAGELLDEAESIEHCRQHLAGFKTPKAVVFVDGLPKNPSGKILKRDLRERFKDLHSPAPASARGQASGPEGQIVDTPIRAGLV